MVLSRNFKPAASVFQLRLCYCHFDRDVVHCWYFFLFQHVAKHCPKLKAVELAFCSHINRDAIYTLTKYCKGLSRVNLANTTVSNTAVTYTLTRYCKNSSRVNLASIECCKVYAARCFRCYDFVMLLNTAACGMSVWCIIRGPKARWKHVAQFRTHSISAGENLALKKSSGTEKVKQKWHSSSVFFFHLLWLH